MDGQTDAERLGYHPPYRCNIDLPLLVAYVRAQAMPCSRAQRALSGGDSPAAAMNIL